MYGSLVVGFVIGCPINGWYHGGINMCGSGVGHPYDPIGGLNGGPPGRFPPDELPPRESPSCPPSGGWWPEPLGT